MKRSDTANTAVENSLCRRHQSMTHYESDGSHQNTRKNKHAVQNNKGQQLQQWTVSQRRTSHVARLSKAEGCGNTGGPRARRRKLSFFNAVTETHPPFGRILTYPYGLKQETVFNYRTLLEKHMDL